MLPDNTIKTSNSRRLYIPYYVAFFAIVVVTSGMALQGQLALPSLGSAAIIVFLGISVTEIHRLYQSYEVNLGSVIHTKGYIAKHSKRIDLFAINDVTVTQTIYQRLFNLGDIHVHVANASHQTTLTNLHNPKHFAKAIEHNMHRIRKGAADDDSDFRQGLGAMKKTDFSNELSEETDAEIFKRLQEI